MFRTSQSRYARSCVKFTVLCTAMAVIVFGVTLNDAAAQQPAKQPSSIIRVLIDDLSDFAAIEATGATPLACRHGVGWQHVHAEAEELEQLQKQDFEIVVEVADADAMIRTTKDRIERNRAARGVSWYADFKDMDDVNTRIDTIVAIDPTIASKEFVGNSLEGRPVYAIKITGAGGGDKQAVLFNGTQHAREWISPMVVTYIAEQLVTLYATDPVVQELIDAVEVYIVPVVNPDGYVYTWGPQRFWRKNRRDNGGGIFGVDLNRNWPTDFGGPFSSGSPSSETYRGPSAISEPESVIMDAYVAGRPNLVAHIDFHSAAQEILQPWGYTNTLPANFAVVDALGARMADAIFPVNGSTYPHASGAGGVGLASGIFPDWTSDNYGMVGYTIELPPSGGGFDPPPATILPAALENFQAAKEMLDWAATRINVTYPSGLPTAIAPDQTTVLAVDIDPLFGDVLVPGTARLFTQTAARGTFTESALAHLGGSSYQATLPATACGETLEFYIQIDNDVAETFSEPRTAPSALLTVDVIEAFAVIDDDFEINMGWTTEVLNGATNGFWQRGVPVNDPSWDYDPASDSDGSGQCWLTENVNGNTDVDNGAVRLTSPALDMTGGFGEVSWIVQYDYYLRLTNSNGDDRMLVEANNDIGVPNWVQIDFHDLSSTDWNTNVIDEAALVTAGVTLTSTMQFRFTVNDSGTQSIVEGGLDAFKVSQVGCNGADIPGDIEKPFGTVDIFDLLLLLSNWNTGGTGAAIAPPINIVDVFDLLELLNNWSS